MLDLKGLYRGTPVDVETDPELYRAVAEAFPEAYLEDPDLNDETRPVLEPHADRITWDANLHSLADVKAHARKAINSKPSRFGSLRGAALAVYEHCEGAGIAVYGGGQGELACGRGQIQYLASLFHPDTPNDCAPSRLQRPGGARRPARTAPSNPSPRRPAFAGASGVRTGRPGSPRQEPDARPDPSPTRSTSRSRTSSRPCQQYIGAAVYYDSETLPRLAGFFYRQAAEERDHAMMMVQYLLDVDEEVRDPGDRVASEDELRRRRRPGSGWRSSRRGASARRSTRCSSSPARADDYRAEQFMQWFVKEQVEEVALMTDLLKVVERAGDNPLLVEDYLARENPGGEADPTAPPVAGATG